MPTLFATAAKCRHPSNAVSFESEKGDCSTLSQRLLGWLVLVSAGFTLIGSLVPFEFRARQPGEAFDSFVWSMTNRLVVESRSDGIANVLLGIPLGFALLGWLCVDRVLVQLRIALRAVAVLLAGIGFAAAVEFAQLFVPARTCCGSDVLAQGLGAIIGMAAWLAFGQRLANGIRAASTGSGVAGRFALGYLVLLGFTQVLPLDLSLSPYKAYHKFRDGGVQLVPFREFAAASPEQRWAHAASLVKLAALYFPAGLIAGCLPGRFWGRDHAGRVALVGLGLVVAIELGQVLLQSRTASTTDSVVGVIAMFLGWLSARFRAGQNLSFGDGLGLVTWWLIAIGVTSWHPFAFAIPVRPFDWLPGSPLEGRNALLVLEEMLTKLVLFGLGGVLVESLGVEGSTRRGLATAFAAGLAISAVCEIGQRLLPNHTPCITDVLLGGIGAVIGAWVAGQIREGPAESVEGPASR